MELQPNLTGHNSTPEPISTHNLRTTATTDPSPWTTQYPGDTHLLTTLREDLIHADLRRTLTRQALHHFERKISQTKLPPHEWNRRLQNQIQFLERRHSSAQTAFYRVLSILQTAHASSNASQNRRSLTESCSTSESQAAGRSQTQSKPPTQPLPTPKADPEIILSQSADIKVVNGAALTEVLDFSAAFWLENQPYAEGTYFCRQLAFVHGIAPEPYAQYLTRRGFPDKPPPRVLFLYYSASEFLRLCQLELDGNSEHLLEGDPLKAKTLL